MTIELSAEQQRVIDLAIQSGAYRDSDEVIAEALTMLPRTSKMGRWRRRGLTSLDRRLLRWKQVRGWVAS